MKNPKITIITVVFNDKKGLEQTINSVQEQTYDEIDFIIVDGESKDGTVQVIKDHISFVSSWVSESDKGIYDAMNKGINLAKGEWIIFLNAGDIFHTNEVLDNVFKKNMNIQEYALIAGSVVYDTGKKFVSYLSDDLYFKNTIHHQAVFYRKELFDNFGAFNLTFKLLADFEFHQRLFLKKKLEKTKALFVDVIISTCSDFGQSKVRHNLLRKERFLLVKSWQKYLKYKVKNAVN